MNTRERNRYWRNRMRADYQQRTVEHKQEQCAIEALNHNCNCGQPGVKQLDGYWYCQACWDRPTEEIL